MTTEESPPDYPEVIWESSIPDSWHRIFAKKKAKTRPATSKSVRVLRSAQGFEVDRQMTTFDHLYHIDSSSRPQTSPKSSSDHFYTIKYLGITNGEIGILSQRKPLVSPKGLSRTRPSTQQMSRLTTSVKDLSQSPQPSFYMQTMEAVKDNFPAEFIKPDPGKYDEYLVHKYSRPRRLNSVKKESLRGREVPAEAVFHPVTAVKPERRGVSGWKLTRPKSHTALLKPKVSATPAQQKRDTVILQSIASPTPRCEAYIQYLLLKKKLKEN